MLNILIHHHPDNPVTDEAALEHFQKQWVTYQKLVDSDSLSHKAVGKLLHDTLTERFAKPFAFLDIACGDASQMRRALQGTLVRHYHGIDLSAPALELAARNLSDMSFEVELDQDDFVAAMTKRPEPADASWCSLSIHHLHTDGKRDLLKAICKATSTVLMIYEPTLADGEDRESYLRRFRQVNRTAWSFLTDDEWEQVYHHVSTCDLPESAATWLELGREAGFDNAKQMFLDLTGFYGVYRYGR